MLESEGGTRLCVFISVSNGWWVCIEKSCVCVSVCGEEDVFLMLLITLHYNLLCNLPPSDLLTWHFITTLYALWDTQVSIFNGLHHRNWPGFVSNNGLHLALRSKLQYFSLFFELWLKGKKNDNLGKLFSLYVFYRGLPTAWRHPISSAIFIRNNFTLWNKILGLLRSSHSKATYLFSSTVEQLIISHVYSKIINQSRLSRGCGEEQGVKWLMMMWWSQPESYKEVRTFTTCADQFPVEN